MNKEGQEEMSSWPFRLLFIVAVGFAVIMIVKIGITFIGEASEIPRDIEDEILLIPRFYNSADCFAYKEEIGVVHTNVIDAKKFKQENMEKCFPPSNVNYAFSLSLEQDPNIRPVFSFETVPLYTFNWLEGSGGKTIVKDVLVFYGGKEQNSKLIIRIKNVK